LKAEWRRYAAAEKEAFDKYHHLFTRDHNPRIEFVAFQQIVLKDMISTFSEEEQAAIDRFIDERFQQAKGQEDRPWDALRVNESQLDSDLKKQYLEVQVYPLRYWVLVPNVVRAARSRASRIHSGQSARMCGV
jgi:hypothetical protein